MKFADVLGLEILNLEILNFVPVRFLRPRVGNASETLYVVGPRFRFQIVFIQFLISVFKYEYNVVFY